MHKIYMSGSGGMLGKAFYDVFSSDYILKCSDIDINEEWLSFLDFRDYESYYKAVKKFSPNFLFHIGAFTDLEYCENNEFETYKTNFESVKNAVKISNILNIPLLYISTAGIFDGKKEIYDEEDTPNPLCHYARSKYLGELHVQKNSSKYIICRAGWMMGGGPQKDKKFVKKIIDQILQGKKDINVVDDKLGTPTYTVDFAKNVKLILEKEKWGLYNLVCEGVTGRYEVANEILKILNLNEKIKINKVDSSFFSKEYFAPRPASERLINKKLDNINLNIMRDWKICLKEYLKKDFCKIL